MFYPVNATYYFLTPYGVFHHVINLAVSRTGKTFYLQSISLKQSEITSLLYLINLLTIGCAHAVFLSVYARCAYEWCEKAKIYDCIPSKGL